MLLALLAGRGNLTAIGEKAYGYSSENYLTSAPGITLSYDSMGRLYQTVGTATQRLGYDGQDLIAEYDGSDALQRRYVHGPGVDEVLAWYEGSGTSDRRWLHADERGSIVAESDGSGASIATNAYDDYGNPQTTNVGRFQYTGQTWIPELGLYYYKARFYNARLGRFMQTDPIGYGGGMNLYAYAGNDPVNFGDPSGTDACAWAEGQVTCNDSGNIIVTGPGNSGVGLISVAPGGGGGLFGGSDDSGGYPAITTFTSDGNQTTTALHNCSYYANCNRMAWAIVRSSLTAQPGYGGFSGLVSGGGESAPQKENEIVVTAKKAAQCALDHFGLTGLGSGLAAAGANLLDTRGKFGGATPGTSVASKAAGSLLGDLKLPVRLPTLTGFPGIGNGLRVSFTESAARFAGRAVPVVGYALLAYDVYKIGKCTVSGGE